MSEKSAQGVGGTLNRYAILICGRIQVEMS